MKLRRIFSSVALLVSLSASNLFAEDQKNMSAKPEKDAQTQQLHRTYFEFAEYDYPLIELILQFFYKADGNLPEINASKEKRIEFVWEKTMMHPDRNLSKTEQTKLFLELWNDADFHIWQLKNKHREAIIAIEKFQRNHSVDSDLKSISDYKNNLRPDAKQVGGYEDRDFPFRLIDELLEINDKVTDAIDAQNETVRELQRLNSIDKLEKTGLMDDNYRSALYKKHFSRIAKSYLQSIPRYLGPPFIIR